MVEGGKVLKKQKGRATKELTQKMWLNYTTYYSAIRIKRIMNLADKWVEYSE